MHGSKPVLSTAATSLTGERAAERTPEWTRIRVRVFAGK